MDEEQLQNSSEPNEKNQHEYIPIFNGLSEISSAANLHDTCKKLLTEASALMEVKTAAVLLLDENSRFLATEACSGKWNKNKKIDTNTDIIKTAMRSHNPIVLSSIDKIVHEDALSGFTSAIICPLAGKGRTVGILVIFDKHIIYPNQLKMLRLITTQASIALENILMYQEIENMFIGTIKALIKTLEETTQWTAGHTERVTVYCHGIATEMGLNKKQIERLRICSLLHDIGKIAVPQSILNKTGELKPNEWEIIGKHAVIGAKMLSGIKAFGDIIDVIKYHHNHWDGSKGHNNAKGADIPLMSRILSVADAFDAMTSDRPYRAKKGLDEAVEEILELADQQFDPDVVKAFHNWITRRRPAFSP